MYNFSRGVDSRIVVEQASRKSVSCDINYGIRFTKVREGGFTVDASFLSRDSRSKLFEGCFFRECVVIALQGYCNT